MAECPNCGLVDATEGEQCPGCGMDVPYEIPQAIPLPEPIGGEGDPITHELPTVAPVVEPPTPQKRSLKLAPGRPRRGARPARRGRPGRAKPRSRRRPPPAAPVSAPEEDAEPHAQLQMNVWYEYSSVPVDDPPVMGVLLGIEAHGHPLVEAESGPVAHVILALDLSASMKHPEKYPVLKEAVGGMLDDLRDESAADVLLSVVVFSRRAQILFRGVRARDIDKKEFFAKIEASPQCYGDYTDIAGALSHAGRIAFDQRKESRVLPVRLYLLTDGQPQDMPKAREVAEKLGKVVADVHGLAFGADSDVVCLQELFAGKRGGTVKSVRKETLGNAFERVADLAQRVVATRCGVRFDLAPGVVGGDAFRYRPARVRFPDPAFEHGKLFEADLGTIETGRVYSLLFEVRASEADETVSDLGRITAEIPGFGGSISETLDLTISRTPAESLPGDIDSSVRTARDILTALTNEDPKTALRALKLRWGIYERERRDPSLLALLRRAIELLETKGSLDDLSPDEHATLLAHTCT